MNTEHTKHPCESVDVSADVMKLAEMILSDCGCSTAISDSLQRRVAGRIQQHIDNVLGGLQQAKPVPRDVLMALAEDVRDCCFWAWIDAKRKVVAEADAINAVNVTAIVNRYAAQPPTVAVPGAVDLLREMEWENNRFADACPVCASSREQGHAADCKLAAVLAAAPQAASESPVQWPQGRDVGRIGDMSQVAILRVDLDADSDVHVCIHGEAGSGSVEFCVPGTGGGKSPRTRAALISLMVAMEADSAETPSRDWWKAREGDEQKGGEA